MIHIWGRFQNRQIPNHKLIGPLNCGQKLSNLVFTRSIFQYIVEFEISYPFNVFGREFAHAVQWIFLEINKTIILGRWNLSSRLSWKTLLVLQYLQSCKARSHEVFWLLFNFGFSRSKLRIPRLPTATQLRRLRQLLSLVAPFKPFWTRKKKSVVLFLYWLYFLALWYWIYFPKSYFCFNFYTF